MKGNQKPSRCQGSQSCHCRNYPLPVGFADLLDGRKVESDRLEFKEGWNPAATFRTICAFANDFHNFGGGYVLVGVGQSDGLTVLSPASLPAIRLTTSNENCSNTATSSSRLTFLYAALKK